MGYFPRSKFEAIHAALNDRVDDPLTQLMTEAMNALDRCLQKVDDDEPIFVLRAQDSTCIVTIHHWLSMQVALASERVTETLDHLKRIMDWQLSHPKRVKMPD